MTDEQIQNSILKRELQLRPRQKFTHYQVLSVLLIIPLVLIPILLHQVAKNGVSDIDGNVVLFATAPLVLALMVYRFQRNRLKLKSVGLPIKTEQLSSVIQKVAEKQAWHLHFENEQILVFKTYPGFFSGSWGEQITLFFLEKEILFNSICDPDKTSSLTSMGRNQKHFRVLKDDLHNHDC